MDRQRAAEVGVDQRNLRTGRVIPYRYDSGGRLEILLIRRLDKERWGIPKGMIDPGATPEQTARAEAVEEAGVSGVLSEKPVGFFSFNKWEGIVHVTVFLMRLPRFRPNTPKSTAANVSGYPSTPPSKPPVEGACVNCCWKCQSSSGSISPTRGPDLYFVSHE